MCVYNFPVHPQFLSWRRHERRLENQPIGFNCPPITYIYPSISVRAQDLCIPSRCAHVPISKPHYIPTLSTPTHRQCSLGQPALTTRKTFSTFRERIVPCSSSSRRHFCDSSLFARARGEKAGHATIRM